MQRLILCQNFNPLPPHGGRPYFSISSSSLKLYFNPLPPHGGRRKYPDKSSHHNYISIHSLHTEGDLLRLPSTFRNQNHFNPLPPHGGRHRWNIRNSTRGSISIHSLHTEGDSACEHDCTSYHISIHSLHTEGDTQGIFSTLSESYFNPLPPHGGRPPSFCFPGQFTGFQSTPSTRRETWAGVTEDDFNDISIHSLHTEGDLLRYVHGGCAISISIHSLHTEGDEDGAKHCTNCGISIHSLHTEGDFSMSKRKSILFISIHSLHTEGDFHSIVTVVLCRISIHSLHTEGDHGCMNQFAIRQHFNPLPPHGGRPFPHCLCRSADNISIHSLHTEGDFISVQKL